MLKDYDVKDINDKNWLVNNLDAVLLRQML